MAARRSKKRKAEPTDIKSATSKLRAKKSAPTFHIAVGIDFGTSLTCVKYTLFKVSVNGRGDRTVYNEDRGAHFVMFNSATQQQAEPFFENVCAFDANGKFLIGKAAMDWATDNDVKRRKSGTRQSPSLLRYLKLGLCPDISTNKLVHVDAVGPDSTSMRSHLANIRAASEKHCEHGNAYELVARFIQQLWQRHAGSDINDTYSITRAEELKSAKLDIVVTRPSLWTFVEDQMFVKAVEKALPFKEIGNIAVFDEAHAVLAEMLGHEDFSKTLPTGKVIVVLDVGGGTADLASVLVQSKKPLKLKDAGAPSSGGVYGVTMLVAQFEQAMERVVKPVYEQHAKSAYSQFEGAQVQTSRSGSSMWSDILRDLVKKFEAKMKDYRGPDCAQVMTGIGMDLFVLNIPQISDTALAGQGYILEENSLKISHEEVQRLFSICVNGITSLTRKQLEDTRAKLKDGDDIIALCVVEGFSKNTYFRRALRKNLEDVLESNRIWFPKQFQKSAVAEGAMQYAKDHNLLNTRILRTSVGFKQAYEWDWKKRGDPPEVFNVEHSPWDEHLEILTDAVRWVFVKGQEIEQEQQELFEGTRCLTVGQGPIKIEEGVYCSPIRNEALEYHDAEHDWHFAPQMEEAAKVYKVGSLGFDIADPLSWQWASKMNERFSKDGERYFEVEYELKVRWAGLRLRWILKIPASGHLDCETAGFPGKRDKTKCPGYGVEPLQQESECNLGAAFGDEQANVEDEEGILNDLVGPVEAMKESKAEKTNLDYLAA